MAERSDPSAAPSTRAGAAPGDALTDLYAAHWASLVRLAWLLVHDQGRAQDLVQDVFVASAPRLEELRERGAALGYLRKGVVNAAMSTHRRRGVEARWLRRAAADPNVPGRHPADSTETLVVARSERQTLAAALQTLPLRQRQVVVLRYYTDLSEQQTADVLGVTTGTVKTHAHRGLAALRDVLGGTP
ncbi:MAG: SigE family RNA polymerase sigma factor [Actinomycetota bacterium]|nr:SigE family RNA polymerase sigma factor [Actinomycetota bacterium]